MSEPTTTLESGDVYMLRGDRDGKDGVTEYYMLIERPSGGAWWMLNLDTGEREWDIDVSLQNPMFYVRIA